jgi:two-component system phosphate regulon sensor histidine kinase PhoR
MKLKKIAIILIFIALLPALFYTAYEITALNENESIITKIYNEQLDAILYSVNQEAWNISNTWANRLSNIIAENAGKTKIEEYISEITPIDAVIITDSLGNNLQYIKKPTAVDSLLPSSEDLKQTVLNDRKQLSRLIHRKRIGYMQLEPIIFRQKKTNDEILVLLFVSDSDTSNVRITGIIFNSSAFIEDVLRPKILQISSEKFVFGIFEEKTGREVLSTGTFEKSDMRQKRKIWLLPDYYFAIRLEGQSIEELAHNRFYRSLQLIVVLDLILLIGVWIIYRNIRTEMKLAQMKSDFVSNVSHELRTPLALIRMFAETLELGRLKSEEKKQEYYRIIGQETERLTHMINNILDFSKIEAGKKHYHLKKTNLNELVGEVLRLYDFHIRNKGFQLEKEIHSGNLFINADEEAVSEALINLLDNAIKYSDKEKFIQIKTGSDHGSVTLDVTDHGIGISEADQNKIFEKFYRVSTGLVHNTKGSGLGLSLIKYIMDMHHGTVTVKSRPNHGSTFRLSFPVIKFDNN